MREVRVAADLSANENPWGASPEAVGAIAASAVTVHRYPDSKGTALKAALAERLGVEPGNVVLGNGSSELFETIGRAVLGDGGAALVGWPSFPAYQEAMRRAGATSVRVPLAGHCYDLGAMAKLAGARNRLLIVANPNNPTGLTFGQAELDRLLDRLPEGTLLCLDEAYGEYASCADFPGAIASVLAGRPLVVVRTLSKAYGLAGLRIGYAIAAEPLARRIDAQRQRFNTSGIAQAAAIAAIGDREHLARTLALNAQGRDWLTARLSETGLFFLPSEANFLLVKVGDGAEACRRLKERGVLVKQLDAFGLPEYIRVSVGRPEENALFIESLQALL
jgi:histidinol-phosphate aminotransferase